MATPPARLAANHEPGLPPPENRVFYPALDGFRALAVLLVFFEHYLSRFYPALNWGWAGVDLFFVLSGFLITGILFDTRDAAHRLRNFYVRRSVRIFPLFYGVLLIALLTTPLFHWAWNRAWILWALYLGNYARFLFLNSPLHNLGAPFGIIEHLRGQPFGHEPTIFLGHFWSLCVEEQFYLVWPAVVFLLRRRTTLRNLCLLSIPLVLAARIACLLLVPAPYLQAELLYRVTPLRADALLIGGAAALALRGPERQTVLTLARRLLPLALLAALLWVVAFRLVTGHFYHVVANAPVLDTIGYTLIDLFAAVLILNLLDLRRPLARAFNLSPLRALGRVSYGFYVFHDLFHLTIARIVSGLTGSSGLVLAYQIAVVAFAVTLLLSALSYRFFEKPFLRLKSRFAN